MAKCLKYLLVILFLIDTCGLAYSQENSRSDTLISILEHSRKDTNRVKILIDIADELIRNNPEEAQKYAQKAVNLSEKLHFRRGIAEGHTMLGSCFYHESDFQNATRSFESAKEVYLELNDKEGVAISCNNIGGIKLKLGYYSDGLKNFISAAGIFEEIGDTYGAAAIYNNIAIVCRKQNDLKVSLAYYHQALRLSEKLNDTELTSGILHNMGSLLHDMDRNDEALEYLKKAHQLRTKNNDEFGIAQTAKGLGTVYLNMGEEEKAMHYLSAASEYNKKTGDLHGLAECLGKIAVISYNQGKFEESRNNFEKSYQLGKELGSIPIQQFAMSWISSIDSINGDLAGALTHYRVYKSLSDSLLTDAKNLELTEMRLNYEKEKIEKEKQLELLMAEKSLKESTLKKTRYLILALLFGCLSIVVIGIMVLQRHKLRTQKRIFELELDKLRQQLEPHFLFNSLNSIQSLLFNGDRKTSNNCLCKLAKLMRMMLDSTQEKAVTLHNEIEFLSYYMDLMSLRFKNKFNYSIIVDENLDIQNFKIPSLLLQPYIENCIYHGLKNKPGKGSIRIEFRLQNDHVHCKIEDNGIGRDAAIEIKHRSDLASNKMYGTRINENRLKLMNSMYGKELGIKFIDLTDTHNKPSGTRVELNLPILMN
jgi:tetratricopeptide (TPR) repeat protein